MIPVVTDPTAQFEGPITVTLSKHACEVLRMARACYPDIPHSLATSFITEEIMAQGLWPGFDPGGSD